MGPKKRSKVDRRKAESHAEPPVPAATAVRADEPEIARLRTALFDAWQALEGAARALRGHHEDYHYRSEETLEWIERAIRAAKEAVGRN